MSAERVPCARRRREIDLYLSCSDTKEIEGGEATISSAVLDECEDCVATMDDESDAS